MGKPTQGTRGRGPASSAGISCVEDMEAHLTWPLQVAGRLPMFRKSGNYERERWMQGQSGGPAATKPDAEVIVKVHFKDQGFFKEKC